MRLVYKGDGDYDVATGDVVLELSYDGSDYAVGDWMLWNVRIGEHRFGGTQHIGPGEFTDWLEQQARSDGGHLPDEPDQSSEQSTNTPSSAATEQDERTP